MSISEKEKMIVRLNGKHIPTCEIVGPSRTKRGKIFFKVSLDDVRKEQLKLIKKAERA